MIHKRYTISGKQALLFVLIMSFFLMSCTKQDFAPTAPVNDMTDTSAVVKYKGLFMNGPYGTVMGNSKIYESEGNLELLLNDVNISNGPDLHVYLSKQIQPIEFIDLGKLKSTNGNQVYNINR